MRFKQQAVNFTPEDRIKELVEQKTQKFEKFKDYIISGDVFLRNEQNNQRGKKVEIKCQVKGKTLFAEGQAPEFEQSIDDAVNKMLRQVRKHKEKMQE